MLIGQELYASSVHCSYYAMLQHLTCKLQVAMNITLDELSAKIESDDRTSHKFLFQETLKFLNKKANEKTIFVEKNVMISQVQRLKSKLQDIKTLRIESDYKNIQIDNNKGLKAYNASQNIINELNTYYT